MCELCFESACRVSFLWITRISKSSEGLSNSSLSQMRNFLFLQFKKQRLAFKKSLLFPKSLLNYSLKSCLIFFFSFSEQFNWDDYLKETGSVAAPPHCFRQVH